MKQKILLSLLVSFFAYSVNAQKKVSAYAITGSDKGSSAWNQVRLIDIATGDELKTVYQNSQDVEILNARTGKAVVKKDVAANSETSERNVVKTYIIRSTDKDGSGNTNTNTTTN